MTLSRAFVFRELQTKTFLGIRNPHHSGHGDFEKFDRTKCKRLEPEPGLTI
jgi:hypothetical protein